MVTAVSRQSDGLHVAYGPLYVPFAAFIPLAFGYSFVLTVRKLNRTEGLERLQLKYLFWGAVVPGLLATVTNLLVPIVTGASRTSPYGPLLSLVMVLVVAHTIIRHRLMSIHVVISRSVAYVLTVLTAASLFVALKAVLDFVMTALSRSGSFWVDLTTALVIALLFQPLRRTVQKITDMYLYRRTYDYQRVLREASTRLAASLDLPSLLRYFSSLIKATVGAGSVSIYVSDGPVRFACLTADESHGSDQPATLDAGSPVPGALAARDGPLLLDELRAATPGSPVADSLAQLGVALALPMVVERELTGFLLLGRKGSGDPYFTEDLDLLSTLASEASVAIKNAQLYREVVRVNEYVGTILATMESGVIAVDRSGFITVVNRAAAQLAAIPAVTPGQSPLTSLPAALHSQLAATLADGEPRLQVESSLSRGDGDEIPVVCSTTALHQPNGDVAGGVIVFSDLTRVKDLENENRRADRLASLGALAFGIAHEIKNPLVAIRTFAELLPERFADSEFRDSFSQVALTEIDRIDQLIARLLGFAPPSNLSFGPVDLQAALDDTLLLLRGQLDRQQIVVRRLFEADCPPVMGDFHQLKQLFLNVLLNAFEAMDRGGILTVRLRHPETDPGHVSVHVADTGSGIPSHLMDMLFEPFVTTKPRGSGLGLAISRGIADAHGATIRVDNNPDAVGATVVLTFPVFDLSHSELSVR
jgi:signal transduction histidine kinase